MSGRKPPSIKRHSFNWMLHCMAILLVLPSAFALEPRAWDELNSVQPETRLKDVQVACGKRHMRVHLEFSGSQPFNGLVFSKGHHGIPECVYVQAGSHLTGGVDFDVYYDKCGTKPDHKGSFYENTIVVQYGQDVIEAWDEAKRLRCEWHDAYEKEALKSPSIQLADLEVQELNFQGDNIGCWMEIQEGKGPWASQVSTIVPLGSPLTMVIAISDENNEFDMRVKSCWAHDGNKPPLHLTDENGCVLRPKMLTPFVKIRNTDGKASILSYSHFYAFKFPDTIEVQMQCVVEICRHGCPRDCHTPPDQLEDHHRNSGEDPRDNSIAAAASNNILDKLPPPAVKPPTVPSPPSTSPLPLPIPAQEEHQHMIQQPIPIPIPVQTHKHSAKPPFPPHIAFGIRRPVPSQGQEPQPVYSPNPGDSEEDQQDQQDQQDFDEQGRSLNDDKLHTVFSSVRHHPPNGVDPESAVSDVRFPTIKLRRRRDASDLGVRGSFRVVANQDLAFKPNMSVDDAPVVYDRRHMGIDIVYGSVCLPATGFTAALSAMSLLVVCTICIASYLYWVLRSYHAKLLSTTRGVISPIAMSTLRRSMQ